MLLSERAENAHWTPTKEELSAMEKNLSNYVGEQIPEVSVELSQFNRQYFGFFRDDMKLIMIILFCEPVMSNWQEELVSVADTAPGCYIEAQYDVAKENFLYLW